MELWLDLDNTLVCAMPGYFREHPPAALLRPEGKDPTPQSPAYYLYPRPGLRALLEPLAAQPGVRVHLWTAGRRRYGERILAALGVRALFGAVRGYEDCTIIGKVAHKDLSQLSGEVVFVDDKPERIQPHGARLLAIAPFTGQPEDTRLSLLREGLLSPSPPPGWETALAAPVNKHWVRDRGWRWVYDWEGRR